MDREIITKAMDFYKGNVTTLGIEAWEVEAETSKFREIKRDALSPELVTVYDRVKAILEARDRKEEVSFEQVDPYMLEQGDLVYSQLPKGEIFAKNPEDLKLYGYAERLRARISVPAKPTVEYFASQVKTMASKKDPNLADRTGTYNTLNLETAFSRLETKEERDAMLAKLREMGVIASQDSLDANTLIVETSATMGGVIADKKKVIDKVLNYAEELSMDESTM